MVEYVLERFLYHLASSPLSREHFVLKGGLLLAQFGARRMTRDIDILAISVRSPARRHRAGSRRKPGLGAP
ncbi:nucleotidyl transferase AbiEii/AbiGii toxin family protein [Streptomyces sp. NPDC006261]|uniref:nucleotidyl transferase AbiEii/AbiGii toxin family protein n=1 Tax=Streptomyces sp. NPDC006261 TaxID=3156739 RepID=UPI0033B1D663